MSKEQRSHLWIPDEEVQRLNKPLTASPTQRNVPFAEHGSKLSHSLQVIKQTLDSIASDNSLVDSDLVVFSVKLPEGEKIQDQKNLFDANGMRVRAVKNIRSAIVTATYSQFQALRRRVDNYAQKGDGKSYFDYIDDFRSYIGSEKNSTELQKTLNAEKPPATVDVQLMLIPNLEKDVYDTALTKLVEKVQKTNGVIQESPYYLSDGTPVVRAIIPASTLTHYENDLAIYRIEETDFLMLTPLKTQ